MVDPAGGPGGPPLFLDQTEAQRAQKNFFGDWPPPLSQGLDDRSPPPPNSLLYLNVWIPHCTCYRSKLNSR